MNDKNIAASFVKGLIAADGNVYFSKNTKEVSIAIKPEEERKFILGLLNLLNFKQVINNTKLGKESIRINNYSNFNLCQKYNLCDIHSKKSRNFGHLIKSYKEIVHVNLNNVSYAIPKGARIQEIYLGNIMWILKEKPLTLSEIQNQFQIKPNAIRRYLSILEKQNKIKRIRTKTSKGRPEDLWLIF